MMVLWATLNEHHINIELCYKGAERKRIRMAVEEAQASMDIELRAYECSLTNLALFKYLD